MKEENQTGSLETMMLQHSVETQTLVEQLCESARIDGLPDKAFFKSFTSRRRREIVYKVTAEAENFQIQLEVHGSGNMKAAVTMPCVSIEDGVIHTNEETHSLSWAHNGEQAVIHTRLDHRHLENYPCPQDIMKAFVDAIDTQKRAICPGGFPQWKAAMQLLTNRIARETQTSIELVAMLPLPSIHTGAQCRGTTDVEVNDISDPESPNVIKGYDDDIKDLDDAMLPEAMTLMMLPPGYLVCRRHREIFTAG